MEKIIAEVDFWAEYRPKLNPLDLNTAWNGCMLETYGAELEHVRATAEHAPNTIWTLLDCDGEVILTNGFHFVNRLGYLITEVPAPEGWFITVQDDVDDDEEDSPPSA